MPDTYREPGYRIQIRDPDPDWIRIQSGQWIRIRIRNPDPDPGGQKWPTKEEKNLYKFMYWSVGWPLLRAEGFFCNLDILYGGLGIGKLQFLIKIFFFSAVIFFNFWSLKPWIRIGSGSVLVSSLNIWIRIRKKWIRIRNTAGNNDLLALGCPSSHYRTCFTFYYSALLSCYSFFYHIPPPPRTRFLAL